MGANYETFEFKCKKADLQALYDELCENCAWESGHGGYSGTFAEARGKLTIQPGVWTKDAAETHCIDHQEKWEPAFAYDLGNDVWYIGAWCSS